MTFEQAVTGAAPKRVVVVDDSSTMRHWLSHVLENDPGLHVIGQAANAEEAHRLIKTLRPDVMTLDIEMPGMNGLAFLEKLMAVCPLPVVIVASSAEYKSATAVRALSLGAVGCVEKPGNALDLTAQRALVRHVCAAASSNDLRLQDPERVRVTEPHPAGHGTVPLILVGASTGGVSALEDVLNGLDPLGPPVVIVQHMPQPFLSSFSQMLNRNLPQEVGLMRDGAPLLAGQIRLVPEIGHQPRIGRARGRWIGQLDKSVVRTLHCPSVAALFGSATAHAKDVIAVLLTGLGRDGAEAMKELRNEGAVTIGQDEASCVVYGMPRVAFEIGAVAQQLPLDRISQAVNRAASMHGSQNPGGDI